MARQWHEPWENWIGVAMRPATVKMIASRLEDAQDCCVGRRYADLDHIVKDLRAYVWVGPGQNGRLEMTLTKKALILIAETLDGRGGTKKVDRIVDTIYRAVGIRTSRQDNRGLPIERPLPI